MSDVHNEQIALYLTRRDCPDPRCQKINGHKGDHGRVEGRRWVTWCR